MLLLLTLLAGLPVTASAGTLVVDQDDPACSDVTGTPYCTIMGAVFQAVDGTTIEVGPGTYTETVDVFRDITIRGAGADQTVVDGNNTGPVFDLIADGTLVGLTIQGGNQPIFGGGGGVRVSGSTSRIVDCEISGNTGAGGGGIKVNGGSLEVLRTTITQNTSTAPNVAGGAGIWLDDGTLNVTDSRIVDNHNLHSGSPGGGVKLSGGTSVFLRTTVALNTSQNNYGGINLGSGSLTLIDSAVHGNEAAGSPGGVGTLGGELTLINTTVTGNIGTFSGGVSIGACCGGTLTLRNATVAGNTSTAGSTGGVVFNADSRVSNSIIAGNMNAGSPDDCSGTLQSEGYNLIGVPTCSIVGDLTGNQTFADPQLLPLDDNGGLTPTMALAPGSPAIDAGNPLTPGSAEAACPTTDQRGVSRPYDGDGDLTAICDIGAYEVSPEIFFDGFESGDTRAWPVTQPPVP